MQRRPSLTERSGETVVTNGKVSRVYFGGGHRCRTISSLEKAIDSSRTQVPHVLLSETSAGNFQAWLKHSRMFPKLLGTFAAQTLTR